MNGFDIDGVIYFGDYRPGIRPGIRDVIISGRSYQEADETFAFLKRYGIQNRVFLNPINFKDKTREKSGLHKVKTLNMLRDQGEVVDLFFEDDPIQAEIIRRDAPWVNLVMVVHDLTVK
jgi:hypothetical protein